MASTPVLLIHSIVALPNDDHTYWLKHVTVNVTNKLIQNYWVLYDSEKSINEHSFYCFIYIPIYEMTIGTRVHTHIIARAPK